MPRKARLFLAAARCIFTINWALGYCDPLKTLKTIKDLLLWRVVAMYRLTPVKDTLTSDCATFQSERCSTLIPTLQQIRVGRTDTFWMRPKKERLIGRVSSIHYFDLFWCSPGHQGFDQIKGWWWLVLIVVLKCAKLCLTVASTNQMNLPWSCCSAEVQLEAEEVPGPEVPWEASVACPFWSDGNHPGSPQVLYKSSQ